MGYKQYSEWVIQLATPEQYPINGELFPSITHIRICRDDSEFGRPSDNKLGYLKLWCAKCYMVDGILYEAPGLEGIYFEVFEPEALELAGYMPDPTQNIIDAKYKVICQYLIDKCIVEGTILKVETVED